MPGSTKAPLTLQILVVDDDGLAAMGLRFLVTNLGYQVVAEARDGREAIQQAELHRPDLILMDIRMPVMNGLDATQEILARMTVPIILVTAYHDEATRQHAQQLGASGYLVKPVGERELQAAIQTVYPPLRS